MEQNRSKFQKDIIPQHVHASIKRAEDLGEERLWGRAYQILVGVEAELSELGVESAFVAWLLAVACDTLGHLEEAIAHIAQARALDLAFNRIITSEKIIVGHVLSLLAAAGCHDPEVVCLVNAMREHFPADHPGLLLVGEKLAEMATDGRERAVA